MKLTLTDHLGVAISTIWCNSEAKWKDVIKELLQDINKIQIKSSRNWWRLEKNAKSVYGT
jgi:hypothetical protein